MGDCDEARARTDEFLKLIHEQFAAIIDRRDAKTGAFFFTEHLPGHDVGVVLHRRNQHFVAFNHARPTAGLSDKVDGLGGSSDKYDLALSRRVQEALRGTARGVVRLGGFNGEQMDATVDVGVFLLVIARKGADHRARLLRGGAVVKVHELAAVHFSRQNRELGANSGDVEGFGRWQRERLQAHVRTVGYRGHATSSGSGMSCAWLSEGNAVCDAVTSSSNRSRMNCSTKLRTGCSLMRSRHSDRKSVV